MFTLSHDVLVDLCNINRFPLPTAPMVFVGLRGATPLLEADGVFGATAIVEPMAVDYLHPRCTLVQWRPAIKDIAIYPGSTVPHASVMSTANADQFNEVFTGYYTDAYTPGPHRRGSPSGHDAFVEDRPFMIVRTHDDTVFNAAFDPVTRAAPGDNLHAAWCTTDGTVGHYSSQGCQVVVGYPDTFDGQRRASGPWKLFKYNGYTGLQRIDYLLISGSEAAVVAGNPGNQTRRLRFGSRGDEVSALQAALVKTGDFLGKPDGDFGGQTLLALIACQKRRATSALDIVDGIAGPRVFAALGLPA